MNDEVEQLFEALKEVLGRVDAMVDATPIGPLGDSASQARLEELMVRTLTGLQQAETIAAKVAGKIHAQCSPELGLQSMSTRVGHRTATSLLTDIGRIPFAEANRLVNNGILLQQASQQAAQDQVIDAAMTTQTAVAQALTEGSLSPAQANEIHKAISKTHEILDVREQAQLATALVNAGEDLSVASLKTYAEKRVLTILAPTPQELERQIREKRYLHLGRMEDGLYPLRGLLDPESAALVKAVFDDASNPNRIIGTEGEAPATGISTPVADHAVTGSITGARTAGQKHLDRLIELIGAGIDANPNQMYTGQRPAVKVIIKAEDLDTDTGQAWLEGIDTRVSAQTAQRIQCNSGTQRVIIDQEGIPLYLGRQERTFTPAQKQALTVRDGGCLWPGCDRPPSWCEAHHITEWENGGHTNLDNGILLCRKHHMELHHYEWNITPVPPGEEAPPGREERPVLYTLHPPPHHPWHKEPIPLASKAPWLETVSRER